MVRIVRWGLIALVLCGLAGVTGAQELVRNGDFSAGLEPWFLQLNGGGAGGKAVADTEGGVLHVGSITDVGTQGYSIQVIQNPVTIVKGVTYRLSLKARASAPRNISVKIGGVDTRNWADYTRKGLGPVFKLDTTMQEFTHEFEMKEATDKAARVEICLGLDKNDVWVDDVSLSPVTGAVVRDGSLQDGAFARGFDYWELRGGANATAAFKDGEAVLAVSKAGTGADEPALEQPGLVFEQGKQYQVSFYARSDRSRFIQVHIGSGAKVWTPVQTIQLGAANQAYTFSFPMKEAVSDNDKATLSFRLGSINGAFVPATVTISKVELKELNLGTISFAAKADTELVKNGHFETDVDGWIASGKAELALDSQSLRVAAPKDATAAGAVLEGLELKAGASYLLAFVARGEAGAAATNARVALKSGTLDLLGGEKAVSLPAQGTQKQYQFFLTVPKTLASGARLELLAPAGKVAWFDRVSVRPAGPWMDPARPVAERVALLMKEMTLAEKAGQMVQAERAAVAAGDLKTWGIGSILSGGGSVPNPNTPMGWIALYNRLQAEALATRLGIPMLYGIDAVHGHGNVYGATIFPHNIGLGATRNPSLIREIGRITALEVAATGLDWTFGPCVAVARDERWGRTYESFGESPELQTLLSAAFVEGLQGLSSNPEWSRGSRVLGTAKHFIGDGGAEFGTGEGSYTIDRGDITTLNMDQLKAIHGQGYVETIKAGVATVMASFNMFEGRHMHARKDLLTDWLKAPAEKGGLAFQGFVVGDWDAMSLISEVAGGFAQKVLASFGAGLDMSMEQARWKEVIAILKKGIEDKTLAQERMDDAVRRILTVKFQSGLFEEPWALDTHAADFGTAANRAVAAQAVKESLVLLKNDKDILPLKAGSKIFVTGPLADNIGLQSGGWTIQWQGAPDPAGSRLTPGISILEGLKATAATMGATIITDPARAKECKVAVVVVGETPYAEGVGDINGYSDMTLGDGGKMAAGNLEAIELARKAGLPVVVVLVSGRPLVVTQELPKWNALVAAWLPGSEAGAMAEVLFGKENFKGKLPMTWPRDVASLPVNVGDKDLAAKKPLFPYGFGLTMKLK